MGGGRGSKHVKPNQVFLRETFFLTQKIFLGGGGNFFNFFSGQNIHQAKSGISSFYEGGGGVRKIKVAQNVLKHVLVLEFLSSDDFLWGEVGFVEFTDKHHSDQIRRSALERRRV